MDPNQSLKELRRAVSLLRSLLETGDVPEDDTGLHQAVENTVEYFDALDEWKSNGGAEPLEWRRG